MGGIAFKFDGVKPIAPAISSVQDNDEASFITIQKDGVTNDTTPVVNGTGAAGSTVKVYDGAQLVGTATVDASGNWSVELNPLRSTVCTNSPPPAPTLQAWRAITRACTRSTSTHRLPTNHRLRSRWTT